MYLHIYGVLLLLDVAMHKKQTIHTLVVNPLVFLVFA